MNEIEARELILTAYTIAFDRAPSEKELELYSRLLVNEKLSAQSFLTTCLRSLEYTKKKGVRSVFPTGHYHSPVVDPSSVRNYVTKQQNTPLTDIKGLRIDAPAMLALWQKHLNFTRSFPFSQEPNDKDRFSYGNGPFPEGDAITLQMIFAEFRPTRVIEIGSGFSTACMLDTADRLELPNFHITCIEPYPERLRALLRDEDKQRVTIVESFVQDVDEGIIDNLNPNDVLFIDSTHVMKTGSDVHFEFFHLLPRLKPGVLVHFHDVVYPFEYPDKWIFDFNYSWNEAYVLRAFLMYNSLFDIFYWNSLLWRNFGAQMRADITLHSGNPGASIWLKRSK
ncbi:MAG: hypothetical protein C5B44_06875 [Acidobacteria bacterium]|nr:MAG: hypothetical protein C5B44_06875 [Acidobacteriota bacterium]